MKKVLFVSILLFGATAAMASPQDEVAIGNSHILKCILLYQFDFVSEPLGLSLSIAPGSSGQARDEAAIGKESAQQLNDFIKTGHLKLRANAAALHMPLSKQLANRCQIIAETVAEAHALESGGDQGDGSPGAEEHL
jgi:hypothetical protein